MPQAPSGPNQDPLKEEVDALLKQLPGADPLLKGDPDGTEASGAESSGAATNQDAVNPDRSRRDRLLVWIRVGLGALAAIAVTQWPYLHECGFSFISFLAALVSIVVAGVWASIWTWKTRIAAAHLIALGVTTLGLALVANEVLPRTAYGGNRAAWRCPAPSSDLLQDRGGSISRPDGTRIRYRDIGAGPVRLIAAGAMVMTDLLRPLADQQRVVLYDPRSRGASSASDVAPAGIDTDVDDLAAVRQHLAADSFAVIGWSHSGATVARFAALRSDIVTRVVLVSTIPPQRATYRMDWTRGSGQDSLGLEMLRIMRLRGEDRTNPTEYCRRYWDIALFRPWMGDTTALENNNLDPCRFENEHPARREASLSNLLDAFGDWDWTGDVGNFTGPVLVIHGTADPIPLEGAEEWVLAFPNARLLSIDGAGHLPWLEQPNLVYEAINTFLAGTWPEGSVEP